MSKEPDNKSLEYDFYYADLQITITVKADSKNTFTELTDNQRTALQQIIYTGLGTFLYILVLNSADDQI